MPKPRSWSIGVLPEHYAGQSNNSVFHLDRPFDIAPEIGTQFDGVVLASLVNDTAAWLYAAGARPWDRVAIIKENHLDYMVLACAAARIGAIPAMISAHLPPAGHRTLLERLDPTVLVVDERVLAAASRARVALSEGAKQTVVVGGPAPAGTLTVDDLRGAPSAPVAPRGWDEPMIVTHTSGTTGLPKLVQHAVRTVVGALGRTESMRWPIVSSRRRDVVASSIPFCHLRCVSWFVGTLALQPSKVVVVSEPDRAEAILRQHRPTTLEALPATYERWEHELLARGTDAFSRVRLFVSTFDAMHPPTVRAFLAATDHRFPVWLQGWGQSETGPMAFRLLTRPALRRRGDRRSTVRNVGRPIPLRMRLKVVDPQTGRPVPVGTPGVALARTKGQCVSYVGEEDRWRLKAEGGWWNTGDLVIRTRTGSFKLVDREIDRIPGMSGIELEDVLLDRLAWASEVIILGVPGGSPLPVLCLADGRPFDQAEWAAATADLPELAPPVVLPWSELPRTGTGKVRRLQLREQLVGRADSFGTGKWS